MKMTFPLNFNELLHTSSHHEIRCIRLWKNLTTLHHQQLSPDHHSRVECFVGVLTSTCCNILICNGIDVIF
jgi:hypothetical protein